MATVPLVEIYETTITTLRGSGLGLNWFEIDMGQVEEGGIGLPIDYPAVLLKLGDVMWRDKTATVQVGEVTLNVKVVFQFKKEQEILNGNIRTEVSDDLRTLENIHQFIIGMSGGTFNKFKRFNQYQLSTKPADLLWIHVMQYQCNIYSDASAPPAALDLDYTKVKDNNAFMERRKLNLIHK